MSTGAGGIDKSAAAIGRDALAASAIDCRRMLSIAIEFDDMGVVVTHGGRDKRAPPDHPPARPKQHGLVNYADAPVSMGRICAAHRQAFLPIASTG